MANDRTNQPRTRREIAQAAMIELRGTGPGEFKISWDSNQVPDMIVSRADERDIYDEILLALRTALSRRR